MTRTFEFPNKDRNDVNIFIFVLYFYKLFLFNNDLIISLSYFHRLFVLFAPVLALMMGKAGNFKQQGR